MDNWFSSKDLIKLVLYIIVSSGLITLLAKQFILNKFLKVIESFKGDIQKRIAKQRIIFEEQINAYKKIFSLCEMSFGKINSLINPLQCKSDCRYAELEDLVEHLKTRKCPLGLINDLEKTFKTDKASIPDKFFEITKFLEREEANITLDELNNFFVVNFMWFSSEARSHLDDFIKLGRKLLHYYKYSCRSTLDREDLEDFENTKGLFQQIMDEIRHDVDAFLTDI